MFILLLQSSFSKHCISRPQTCLSCDQQRDSNNQANHLSQDLCRVFPGDLGIDLLSLQLFLTSQYRPVNLIMSSNRSNPDSPCDPTYGGVVGGRSESRARNRTASHSRGTPRRRGNSYEPPDDLSAYEAAARGDPITITMPGGWTRPRAPPEPLPEYHPYSDCPYRPDSNADRGSSDSGTAGSGYLPFRYSARIGGCTARLAKPFNFEYTYWEHHSLSDAAHTTGTARNNNLARASTTASDVSSVSHYADRDDVSPVSPTTRTSSQSWREDRRDGQDSRRHR
ncbi:hypothetical protein B0H66DRAFT_297050 [Apodospora peruviana]|uniref:Uncharacterized protein n=1 Tax=Apodospora peruviana TaxID=516989 RepID=A0AAE0I1Q9_9PEZI|nr:hypothetical protein B0H66DRAFT_297050 [Apodospora peruviana]